MSQIHVASVGLSQEAKSPFWVAQWSLSNGKRVKKSTKVPVTVDLNGRDEAFLTNISVIDFTHGGKRLFSLELTIENPISNAEGMAAPASGRQAQNPNGVSDVRLAAFESFVKREKRLKLNEMREKRD